MIRLENLTKRLGSFHLSDITMEIHPGDYVVLLGDSGSGKTVLLEILAGLIQPDHGEIYVDDRRITRDPIRKRPFGIVFQDLALFPHLTVFQNLAYPLLSKGLTTPLIRDEVKNLARQFEISHLLDRPVSGLSGGERQRTALARTLAKKPACLLLDEPLSALDVRIRTESRILLSRLNQNQQTIIHVTHDYLEAASLASHIGILEQGRLAQFGPTRKVLNDPSNPFRERLTEMKKIIEGSLKPVTPAY